MKLDIIQGARCGCVTIPASKSQAHRLLICAALGSEDCVILCDGISKDIAATIACLNALGAEIRETEAGQTPRPPDPGDPGGGVRSTVRGERLDPALSAARGGRARREGGLFHGGETSAAPPGPAGRGASRPRHGAQAGGGAPFLLRSASGRGLYPAGERVLAVHLRPSDGAAAFGGRQPPHDLREAGIGGLCHHDGGRPAPRGHFESKKTNRTIKSPAGSAALSPGKHGWRATGQTARSSSPSGRSPRAG